MRKILFSALAIVAFATSTFASGEEAKVKKSSELTVEETTPPTVSYEIVDIKYDEVAPCTLKIKVTVKLIVDGIARGETTVDGELRLENCSDIADIGVAFVTGLVKEAIDKALSLI